MAMSGVKMLPECQDTYQSIKRDKKWRYAIFKISDGHIVLEKTGDRSSSYKDFVDSIKAKVGDADDCRYGLFDYEYVQEVQGTEASHRTKLFLLSWCPDSAKIKSKMIYSSSFDTLKQSFLGVQKVIQANDEETLQQDNVENILKATDRK